MSEAPGELRPEVALWLVSTDGRDAVARATGGLDDGIENLRVVTALRRDGLDQQRAAAAIGAAQARLRARTRWPDADQLLFTRSGLEQASDPAVSAWRARRFAGHEQLEDRAAGCGGDTLALAGAGAAVTALDLDEGRLTLLAHNASVRGLEVRTWVADALVAPAPLGPVHCDPGRRVEERRVRRLADHRPPVPRLVAHLTATVAGPGLAVVLSPGVELDDPDLPSDAEVEFVQLGDQLVEAVAWFGALRRSRWSATVLAAPTGEPDPAAPAAVTRSRGDRGPRLPVGAVGAFLLEVVPAAVRARLHDEVGAEAGARRLASRRALLTVDDDPGPSPWWRTREVEAVLPAGARQLRRWLREADELPVEIVLHGVQVDPEHLHRQLGAPPRGPSGRRIELVRGDEGAFAVVTRPPPPARA